MTTYSPLSAISPLDGRYHHFCQELKAIASEYGLMRYRFIIEIKWLQTLVSSHIHAIPTLSETQQALLNQFIVQFSEKDATAIKTIEAKTNHDVKAVEYYLKEKIAHDEAFLPFLEYVHFACTSEDINNLAYGLMMQELRSHVLTPQLSLILSQLQTMAINYAAIPMLSRTHGQAASPTTVGKEIANFVARLKRQMDQFTKEPILGKMNGAVGNYNAHCVAFDAPWPQITQEFVASLGLTFNPLTTQIEPHDAMAAYFHNLMRINTLLIDMCRDIWGYIGLGYFKQKVIETETGSSTMPHKVNPIDFENSEGNFGLANALFGHFAQKLPISRWQRDLSDSTVLRNIGVACGYMLIALKSLNKGLLKLDLNKDQLQKDLNDNSEVLSEAIQTVLRCYPVDKPYEKLKAFTRGQKVTLERLHQFIDSLEIPKEAKEKLKALTPSNYIGLAEKLVKEYLE